MIGNIFKDLLQQCDVSYKCKLLSFTAEKTVFKNKVSLQKCLTGDWSIYAQRQCSLQANIFTSVKIWAILTCFADIGLL